MKSYFPRKIRKVTENFILGPQRATPSSVAKIQAEHKQILTELYDNDLLESSFSNTKEKDIILVHIPTGISVRVTGEKSRYKARQKAEKLLLEKINETE